MSDVGEVSLGTYGGNETSLGTYGGNEVFVQTSQPPKRREDVARASGYSWEEIDAHMARSSLAAANLGYTQEEIDTYLGYTPKTLDQYQEKWASAFGDDPELFQRYEADPLSMNLADSPSWRADYAEALNTGVAKGPLDFAYDYAANVLNAMTSLSGSPIALENDRLWEKQKLSAAVAAENMAADLAHPREITDAALRIGGQFDTTRQNVMNEWMRTGYSPRDIALKASVDEEYRGKLVGSYIFGDAFEGSVADEIGKGVIRGSIDIITSIPLIEAYAWKAIKAIDPSLEIDEKVINEYVSEQVKIWADREKKWKEGFEQGEGIQNLVAGTVGGAVPTIAGLVAAGVPAMIAYASLAGAAKAYRDTSSLPAAATGAAVGAFAMGAPVPFLKGAIGRSVIEGAVYGAVGIGGMGALQTFLDPLSKYVAGQGYETPTPEQVGGAFISGAVLGGLIGTFGAATRPTKEVIDFDNNTATHRPLEEVFEPTKPAAREPVKAEDGATPTTEKPPFVKDATPSQKLEALVQEQIGAVLPRDAVQSPEFQAKIAKLEDMRLTREGITPDEFDKPNFFTNLAKNEDAATKNLAKGYDATANSLKFFKKVYDDLDHLFKDETGGVPLPQWLRDWAERRKANIAGKEVAEILVRRIANGRGRQTTDVIANSLEQFYPAVSPHMPAYLQELADVKAQGVSYGGPRSMIGKAIHQYETGGLGAIDKNNSLYPLFEHYTKLNQLQQIAITRAEQSFGLNPVSRLQNYYQHMFKRSKDAKHTGAGGGAMGNTGWMRERRIPTTWEAMQEGYEPRYQNPIEHIIKSSDMHYRTLQTYEMLDTMRKIDDGFWAYWSTEGPKRQGDIPLTGLGTKKYARNDKGITQLDSNGTPIELQMYGQSGTARTWNNMVNWENFVSSGSGGLRTTYDLLLRMKNTAVRFKLFFPFFHMISLYKQSINMGVTSAVLNTAWGLQNLARGNKPIAKDAGLRALTSIRDIPWQPVRDTYKTYTELEPMYKSLMNDPGMQAYIDGGMRVLNRDVHGDYAAGRAPTFYTEWKRGELAQRYTPWEKPGGLKQNFAETAKLPLRAISQLATSLSAPFWHHQVRYLKTAAGHRVLSDYIASHPNATEAQLATASRQIAELMDSRFGMAEQSNLFWRPVLKGVTQTVLLSQLWKYGTIQSTVAGLGWRMGHGVEWNPFATVNLATQMATVAFLNAAWSYFLVGKVPDEIHDYLIPFATARAFATMGTRVMIPGEEKEYHDWWRIVAKTYAVGRDFGGFAGASEFTHGLMEYGRGALQPHLQAAANFVFGYDAIGHDIKRRPEAMARFLLDSYGPIFWNGMDQADLKGVPQWQNILGIRNVSSLEQDFQKYLEGESYRGRKVAGEELRRALKEKGTGADEIKKIMKEYRQSIQNPTPKTPRLAPTGSPGSFRELR